MTMFLILYAVVLAVVLALAAPRLSTMTPRLRRLFAMTAGAGVLVFGGVLWWALSA
jgi:hypothetical protein